MGARRYSGFSVDLGRTHQVQGMSAHTTAGAASTTPLIEDVRSLTWYVKKAHATFHGRNHPREICVVCDRNDKVIARLEEMNLPPHS